MHVSWCIARINGKEEKVAVTYLDGSKFKIVWTNDKDMIGDIIDASDIRRVMINNPPDYCKDTFRLYE